jgi:ribosomal protein S18 acetylase RimI-like enzyme
VPVTLIDLTDEEFASRWPAMAAHYGRELARAFGAPLTEPQAATAQEFRAQFPDGVRTPGQLVRKAMIDGVEAGFLWMSLPGTTFPDRAWLSLIEVPAELRGRGYGSRIIAAGEADLVARGVRRTGLHVFGHNAGARRLYGRLGHRVLNQIHARPVRPGGEPGLTLAPMPAAVWQRRLDEVVERDPGALTREPGATAEQARRIADKMTAAGDDSPRDAYAGGRPVGWIWYSPTNPLHPAMAMVQYVAVDAAVRRRGHGRAMIEAVEAELAARGVSHLGLRVAADRADMIALAEGLGLAVVSQQMIKDL